MSVNLHEACRSGDVLALTKAIGEGANLNQRDKHARTPLHMAAWAGQVECVKALLAAGVQVGLVVLVLPYRAAVVALVDGDGDSKLPVLFESPPEGA